MRTRLELVPEGAWEPAGFSEEAGWSGSRVSGSAPRAGLGRMAAVPDGFYEPPPAVKFPEDGGAPVVRFSGEDGREHAPEGRTTSFPRPNTSKSTGTAPSCCSRSSPAARNGTPSRSPRTGRVNPGSGFVGNQYVRDLLQHPPQWSPSDTSPWGGLSGAAGGGERHLREHGLSG
ncbi:hypothetical protein ACFRQM_35980 [Streptomyces sp. NPDC056831]|uniref:hypothetical protein n=1 Tax=Streptomyces sp. NPDC056831 TaxID=3345954 RepID=UPI0036CE4256